MLSFSLFAVVRGSKSSVNLEMGLRTRLAKLTPDFNKIVATVIMYTNLKTDLEVRVD